MRIGCARADWAEAGARAEGEAGAHETIYTIALIISRDKETEYEELLERRSKRRNKRWGYLKGKFGSIPLKDHHFRSIPLLSHLHVGPHESMTCEVHGIYLKFGSFNGIDPIVPI
jgi:hypothetical protein